MIYKPFIDRYSHVLQYEKEGHRNLHARYTWNDEEYRDFMREIISKLEPREEKHGTVLI